MFGLRFISAFPYNHMVGYNDNFGDSLHWYDGE